MNRNHLRQLAVAVAVCASFVAGSAHAQYGINVSWDDCANSGNGHTNKTVACANTGVFNLLCSFASPEDMPALSGVRWTLDIGLPPGAPGPISSWWADPHRITVDVLNNSQGTCGLELWNLTAQPPVAEGSTITQPGPNRVRIRGSWGFLPGDDQPIVANQEYYSHTFQVTFAPGTADDLECAATACLNLTQLDLLTRDGVGSISLFSPLEQQVVSWQGLDNYNQCFFAVPTERNSWGQIKALYR